MKKHNILFVFCLAFVLAVHVPFAQAGTLPALKDSAVFKISDSKVIVDESQYDIDAAPFAKNGRAYVPLRCLGEMLGANVTWDNGEAILGLPLKKLHLKVGRPWLLGDNGVYELMDVAPEIFDPPGRVFLPARFVAEAAGCSIKWDEASRTVTISKNN